MELEQEQLISGVRVGAAKSWSWSRSSQEMELEQEQPRSGVRVEAAKSRS